MEWTEEQRKKRSEEVQKRWRDKKFRAKVIPKQKALGYRAYGEPINHFKKEHVKGY